MGDGFGKVEGSIVAESSMFGDFNARLFRRFRFDGERGSGVWGREVILLTYESVERDGEDLLANWA
jgi:hypothetical protein